MTIYKLDSDKAKLNALKQIGLCDVSAGLAVELAPFKKIRTNAQNQYYWALLGEVEEATGKDKDVLHEWFKMKFIGVREEVIDGEVLRFGMPSHNSGTALFSDYVTKVQSYVQQEMGIKLQAYGYAEL